MLEREKIKYIQENFKIPCRGFGLGGTYVSVSRENYIITLDARSAEPTDKELNILTSYREFMVELLYKNHEEILSKEFPAEKSHNTSIFLKGEAWLSNGKEGWCLRQIKWDDLKPPYIPAWSTRVPAPPPWTLIQLLDHKAHSLPGKWKRWKLQHPGIFAT